MTAPQPIRILVADDHAVVRQGIRHVLEEDAGLQVVAEAATGGEVLERAARERPDVVLLAFPHPSCWDGGFVLAVNPRLFREPGSGGSGVGSLDS